jgi:hypothetical protein
VVVSDSKRKIWLGIITILGVDEGKLLGHIIPKDGVKIDPKSVEAIKKIPLPPTKKSLQSFLGQINFVR